MAIAREGRICSFCGEPGGPGTELRLIGGLGAQVCERCVNVRLNGLRRVWVMVVR